MTRPAWAETSPLLRDYYDTEWGFPVRDTPGVYERLTLEGFQSGLAWSTILRKRDAFRAAFAGFDPVAVAAFDEADVARLMADAGIVRNEQKIRAAITNARATVAMSENGDDLAELVWSFRPDDPTALSDEHPSRSPESIALAKELRRRGFTFVGPVTLYAAMEAIGVLEHREREDAGPAAPAERNEDTGATASRQPGRDKGVRPTASRRRGRRHDTGPAAD